MTGRRIPRETPPSSPAPAQTPMAPLVWILITVAWESGARQWIPPVSADTLRDSMRSCVARTKTDVNASTRRTMARTLLERGASPTMRASPRKFLDWIETLGRHESMDVTPAEWGRKFPRKKR